MDDNLLEFYKGYASGFEFAVRRLTELKPVYSVMQIESTLQDMLVQINAQLKKMSDGKANI